MCSVPLWALHQAHLPPCHPASQPGQPSTQPAMHPDSQHPGSQAPRHSTGKTIIETTPKYTLKDTPPDRPKVSLNASTRWYFCVSPQNIGVGDSNYAGNNSLVRGNCWGRITRGNKVDVYACVSILVSVLYPSSVLSTSTTKLNKIHLAQ